MSKYSSLTDWLRGQDPGAVTVSFTRLDRVVTGGLPTSARTHREWWGNHNGNPQARGWLDAGRTVGAIDLNAEQVTFSPARSSTPPVATSPPVVVAPTVSAESDRSPPTIDWEAVWSATAELMDPAVADRRHLLTEHDLRQAAAAALVAQGLPYTALAFEHPHPHRIGRIDLVIKNGDTVTAAIEFKYPRDPSSAGAADTMTYGELVADLYRLAVLPSNWDRFAVQLIEPRLAGHLTAVTRKVPWVFQPDASFTMTPTAWTDLPKTAGACVPESLRGESFTAQCVAVHNVGALLFTVWDLAGQ